MMQNQNSDNLESLNEQIQKAYISGVVDGNSTIGANISKDSDYKIGYSIDVRVRITRQLPFALQVIDDFCFEKGIRSRISEKNHSNREDVKGTRYSFEIQSEHDIQLFLEQIYPFLRDRREEAEILSQNIIPSIQRGEHLEKESFLQIVEDIDTLREMNPHVTHSKYDTEYFKEEWGR